MAKKKAQVPATTTEEGVAADKGPLTAELRGLIELGRKRGYLTQDEILEQCPGAEQNVDEIDRIYSILSGQGIEIVEEAKEAEEKPKEEEQEEAGVDGGSCHLPIRPALPQRGG